MEKSLFLQQNLAKQFHNIRIFDYLKLRFSLNTKFKFWKFFIRYQIYNVINSIILFLCNDEFVFDSLSTATDESVQTFT